MNWAAPGIGAFTLAAVLVTLSTVFVALRFVSRRRILNIWGATDWFMLVTLVGTMKTRSGTKYSPNTENSSLLLRAPPPLEPVRWVESTFKIHLPCLVLPASQNMPMLTAVVAQLLPMGWATTSSTSVLTNSHPSSRFVPPSRRTEKQVMELQRCLY